MRYEGCSFVPLDREQQQSIEKLLPVEIGILGGSGNYDPTFVENPMELKVHTPYGAPSDHFIIGMVKGRKVAFLARHGRGHVIPPHNINYRANIWGFKALGVKSLLSPGACGSLQEDLPVGEFVICDQVFDRTFALSFGGNLKASEYHFGIDFPLLKVTRSPLSTIFVGFSFGNPFNHKQVFLLNGSPNS